MGGSPPSPPTVVMPSPTAPTTYRSQVPLESYKQAADYVRRLTEKTEAMAQKRYQEVGTPAEIGARQAQRRLKEEASYLSSLPQSDKYLQEATGKADAYEDVRTASKASTSAAADEYLMALQKSGEAPKPISYEEPEWAKWTVPEDEPVKEKEKEEEKTNDTASLDERIKKLESSVTPNLRSTGRGTWSSGNNPSFIPFVRS